MSQQHWAIRSGDNTELQVPKVTQSGIEHPHGKAGCCSCAFSMQHLSQSLGNHPMFAQLRCSGNVSQFCQLQGNLAFEGIPSEVNHFFIKFCRFQPKMKHLSSINANFQLMVAWIMLSLVWGFWLFKMHRIVIHIIWLSLPCLLFDIYLAGTSLCWTRSSEQRQQAPHSRVWKQKAIASCLPPICSFMPSQLEIFNAPVLLKDLPMFV